MPLAPAEKAAAVKTLFITLVLLESRCSGCDFPKCSGLIFQIFSRKKIIALYADYSMLNLCVSEDDRNPDVISEAYFTVRLDKAHFLSLSKD